MSKSFLKVASDFSDKFNETIKLMREKEVLVGIPESDSTRTGDSMINNASLLFINQFGSPVNNIPARPVMTIGIKNSEERVAKEFESCAKSVLSKGTEDIDMYFQRVGIIASNSIKKVINEQDGIVGPAESTLRARERRGFKGTKSLVVTGQMRSAITYVVGNKSWPK